MTKKTLKTNGKKKQAKNNVGRPSVNINTGEEISKQGMRLIKIIKETG